VRRILLTVGAAALLPAALPGQSVAFSAARWLTSPHVSEYRLGMGGLSLGPARVILSGQYVHQAGGSRAHWYGGGAELAVRITPDARPYVLAGVGVGVARDTSNGDSPSTGAWGGVGAELYAIGPVALQAEALYNWRGRAHLSGASLVLQLATRFGRKSTAPPASTPSAALPKTNPSDEQTIQQATAAPAPSAATVAPAPGVNARTAAADVVVTAVGAMGTPYRWGGSAADGYDCSGLIQYAYAAHGVSVPRTSLEQAGAGRELGRDLSGLLPGDILTFSSDPGGGVSHVGLYVGNRRFIHSAQSGVQISVLSDDDPVGKWWWKRWVGARRIVE
jgi:cell wall-associated NlpC family hydrolase